MTRPAPLAFLCLALFAVLFPLVLEKPGWPAGLKADEPAYYLMALSLAQDGDLRLELEDLERLFAEFPYNPTHNLILATDDGWRTIYYGKPYLYSLFAAPWAAAFGASGLVAFNMALLMAMVAMGWRYLARWSAEGLALLYSTGFFVLSAGFAYVFWLHPEVFNMASVTAALYLGFAEPSRRAGRGLGAWLASPGWRAAVSGAALSLGVYNKPMLAAFALPLLYPLLRDRRWRAIAAWTAGAALSLTLAVGGAMALTGHPSAYFLARGAHKVCSPEVLPVEPLEPPPVVEPAASGEIADGETAAKPPRASWFWIFRVPDLPPAWIAENLGYFLWGRHTGLFLYFPFALLSLLLFAFHARRSPKRWALLAALVTVALFFLFFIPFNWQGGGGFIGNRYYVNAYPGFLFLVTRIAPRALVAAGYALGGLCLGPILFTPLGRAVPEATLQAHVRNFPFTRFPLELSLREMPGYVERAAGGALVRGRADRFLPRGAGFWTHGAATTEIWLQATEPLEPLVLRVASPARPNTITLRLGDAVSRLEFGARDVGPGETGPRQVELRPRGPTRKRRARTRAGEDLEVWVYRLEVTAERGAVRPWTRRFPPQDCPDFAWNETLEESFYVGAEITYMGTPSRLALDLYALEWGEIEVPERVAAGSTFTLRTRARNASGETWPADPPVRVGLSYRWRDAEGRKVGDARARAQPEEPTPPGAWIEIEQEIEAPTSPGSYVLELDAVYELVAWFSDRNNQNVYRAPVEVTPAPQAAP